MVSGGQLQDAIGALEEAIDARVVERQALWASGASAVALEANRLEIGRLQRQLSSAAIRGHRSQLHRLPER